MYKIEGHNFIMFSKYIYYSRLAKSQLCPSIKTKIALFTTVTFILESCNVVSKGLQYKLPRKGSANVDILNMHIVLIHYIHGIVNKFVD